MYKHHQESIQNMVDYFKKEGAIALILGGSVAKGTARADSDLDGMVILSEQDYEERERRHATTETINGLCTYENGYFDVKYMTKEYLKDLAEKGSEPARNSFTKAKLLFSTDAEIEHLLPQIPVFQKKEKAEKLLSFYSCFWLNYYYFLKSCSPQGYMRLHTIADIIYSLYRMILQENEILFDCHRRLEDQVRAVSKESAELVELAEALEKSQDTKDADAFVEKFLQITTYTPPEDFNQVLTSYSKDFQEWWRESRPHINEW